MMTKRRKTIPKTDHPRCRRARKAKGPPTVEISTPKPKPTPKPTLHVQVHVHIHIHVHAEDAGPIQVFGGTTALGQIVNVDQVLVEIGGRHVARPLLSDRLVGLGRVRSGAFFFFVFVPANHGVLNQLAPGIIRTLVGRQDVVDLVVHEPVLVRVPYGIHRIVLGVVVRAGIAHQNPLEGNVLFRIGIRQQFLGQRRNVHSRIGFPGNVKLSAVSGQFGKLVGKKVHQRRPACLGRVGVRVFAGFRRVLLASQLAGAVGKSHAHGSLDRHEVDPRSGPGPGVFHETSGGVQHEGSDLLEPSQEGRRAGASV
mmetsp:Transcript_9311/g.27797  ORF Transcript_9311/g.27797 Transcript_9311/m.27797 type:complete len:311 (-) Transcript_9311:245-1177(-)